jgi:hypothetical protein
MPQQMTWPRLVGTLSALFAVLLIVAVGADVAWKMVRPAASPVAALAVARDGLWWQAQLGVSATASQPPPFVAPQSQAAQWARYVAALAREHAQPRIVSSRLASVSLASQAWSADAGYVRFRVADRRWFIVKHHRAPVPEVFRGVVTIYLRQDRHRRWMVSGIAYLPDLAGVGSPSQPSLYPDWFTTAGNNPLGG